MRIYTKGGDRGVTALYGGRRVQKDDPRIEACGAVDEANAALGWIAVEADESLRRALAVLQAHLFDIGAELATPPERGEETQLLTEDDVTALEHEIDRVTEHLPPLERFILPGGCELAARLHWGRTAVRRAERRIVALHQHAPVRGEILRFINRLSDLLFVWARHANAQAGSREVEYSGRERRATESST